jgi:hypothetical protein
LRTEIEKLQAPLQETANATVRGTLITERVMAGDISLLISSTTRPGAGGRSEETWGQRGMVRWNAALVKTEASMVRSLPED